MSRRMAAVAVSSALVMAACGEDADDGDDASTASETSVAGTDSTAGTETSAPDENSSSSTEAPSTSEAGAEAEHDEPIDADAILRVGTAMDVNNGPIFDMSDHNQGLSVQWLDLIYDTMIRKTPDGMEPGLATEWTVVDEQTLDITLRDGVVFQDGEAFDAAAVANAWNRPKPEHMRPEVRAVENVEVVDPLNVRVHFSAPVAGDFVSLTMVDSYFPVPSPAALAAHGDDYEAHPVGAGPYALAEYKPNQSITFESWDGYWDPEGQHLGGVEFLNIAVGAPTVASLASGQIDLAQIGMSELEAVQNQDNLDVVVQSSPATYVLNLCQAQAPFDSLEVRQALAQAIDREEINIGVLQGAGQATNQWFPPDAEYYSEELAAALPFDPDAADALWAQGSDDRSISIFAPSADPNTERMAEILQSQLGEIGVEVEILSSPDVFDVARLGADSMIVPPRPASYFAYYGGGALNWCGYQNPEIEAALAIISGGAATDDELADAWMTVNAYFSADLPGVFLVNQPVVVAHSTSVGGVGLIRDIFGMSADLRSVVVLEP